MKLLLVSLLVVACLRTCALGINANGPDICCFSFYEHRIPVNAITTYETTRSECPKPGVVFTTKKAARMCADPGLTWVREAMKKINRRDLEISI
ncbi:C-C motif chemokine 4 homolog [Brachyhypopomus gauderio]|uniref:C-C motif chemokine 4 homolog n=1 Tax=Brachyhypopomus gauderio TaxID=698409 RepID=UPI00404175D7